MTETVSICKFILSCKYIFLYIFLLYSLDVSIFIKAPTTQVEQVETPAGENLLPLNDKKCNDDFTNKKDANIIRPNRNTESDVRNFNRQKPRSDEDSKESVESGYCEDFMSDSATHLIERSMSEPSSTTINISGVPGGFDEHTDNSIAHIYNNQWNVSICNNPVTQESEPHLQLNTKVFQGLLKHLRCFMFMS